MHAEANDPTLALTCELISRPSVTPDDAGCLDLIGQRLARCGFTLERFDHEGVSNLWATRGATGPVFCFAGHTDVVPTGELSDWHSDPFEPVIRDGVLFGRGAADMKGSIAAMVTAVESLCADGAPLPGTLALLLTSDDEGIALHGTRRVVEALRARGERIDYCLVGEPSSMERLGDLLRNGRRGSLTGHLKVLGVQGQAVHTRRHAVQRSGECGARSQACTCTRLVEAALRVQARESGRATPRGRLPFQPVLCAARGVVGAGGPQPTSPTLCTWRRRWTTSKSPRICRWRRGAEAGRFTTHTAQFAASALVFARG